MLAGHLPLIVTEEREREREEGGKRGENKEAAKTAHSDDTYTCQQQ